LFGVQAGEVGESLPGTDVAVPEEYLLKVVPNQAAGVMDYAQEAIKIIATEALEDSLESRIGQAMHRLLEWVSATDASAPPLWSAAQLARAAQEFELDAAQADTARGMAQRIVQGEGAWAWDAAQLQWQGNEVAIAHRGRTLRLDRLVQHRATQEWWVLDYKSTAQPQHQRELLAQLSTYRTAVALAYPGQTVRAAFLTALGALIEPAGS
jgi:ATP-dependent helicase/nuclease subunit A